MEKFVRLTGVAAPLPMINVDTDMIIPKQFLKTIKRTGLGEALFYELRYDEQGAPRQDFILNRPPFNQAQILIAGENFGCGSSREHAPWALLDFGIRCVIAPSFADIFYSNCFKNGILPITLTQEAVDRLVDATFSVEYGAFTIDLDPCKINGPGDIDIAFEVDPFLRECLLNGLDEIELSLQKASEIDAYETERRSRRPWL